MLHLLPLAYAVGLHAVTLVNVISCRSCTTGIKIDLITHGGTGCTGRTIIAALLPTVTDVTIISPLAIIHGAFQPIPVHQEFLINGQAASTCLLAKVSPSTFENTHGYHGVGVDNIQTAHADVRIVTNNTTVPHQAELVMYRPPIVSLCVILNPVSQHLSSPLNISIHTSITSLAAIFSEEHGTHSEIPVLQTRTYIVRVGGLDWLQNCSIKMRHTTIFDLVDRIPVWLGSCGAIPLRMRQEYHPKGT
ncbi:hypothetical protein Rhal01_03780 [Rubritalea halochordaticola]|uniref:Uncharacterized protein n=1 Tax=Rubritalea halochordaticola TaxID=714537 RepID=A0ABP9V7Q7_9BACT